MHVDFINIKTEFVSTSLFVVKNDSFVLNNEYASETSRIQLLLLECIP